MNIPFLSQNKKRKKFPWDDGYSTSVDDQNQYKFKSEQQQSKTKQKQSQSNDKQDDWVFVDSNNADNDWVMSSSTQKLEEKPDKKIDVYSNISQGLRNLDIFSKNLGMGTLNTIMRMFGGGPESNIEAGEILNLAQKQGTLEPELPQSINDLIDQATKGKLIPTNESEERAAETGEFIGEFITPIAQFEKGFNLLRYIGKEASTGALFKIGSDIAKDQEAGEVEQAVSGAALAFSPQLLKGGKHVFNKAVEFGKDILKAKGMPVETPKFLTEVSTPKAIADLELSSKDLTGRVAKTSKENVNKFDELVGKVAEPDFRDIERFNPDHIEREIVRQSNESILNTVSPHDLTSKRAWEAVKTQVDNEYNAAREVYRNLYKISEYEAENTKVFADDLIPSLNKFKEDLTQSLIKLPEESGLVKRVENIINRISPEIEHVEKSQARKFINREKKNGNRAFLVKSKPINIKGKEYVKVSVQNPVTVKELMATKKSINRILKKSNIMPAPVDLLKPINRAVKSEIINALGGSEQGIAFRSAEELFQNTIEKYANEPILKLRKSLNPEEMGSLFTKPSNLEKLNEAISSNEIIKDVAHRKIIESISNKKSIESALSLAGENRRYLSDKADRALDALIRLKDKKSSEGAQKLLRGGILNDLQNSYNSGIRPSYTLKLMQTQKGYATVKNILSRSQSGRKMLKSLQRMTFEDMIASVMTSDKSIDFEKAKDILAVPNLRNIILDAMGSDGLKFFENLERYGKNMSENMKNFKNKEPSIFRRFIDKYIDSKIKYILFALLPKTTALTLFGNEFVSRLQRAKLFRVLEDKKSMSLINQLGSKNSNINKFKENLRRFAIAADNAIEKSEDE